MAKFKGTNGEDLSLDQILEDSEYQAEFDRKVNKALEKHKVDIDAEVSKRLDAAIVGREEEIRKNIQDDIENQRREAEENAKLTEAEKFQKMIDQQNQKIADYENKLAIVDREAKMKTYIKEKGYDADAILTFLDARSVTDSNYEDKIDAVNDKLNDRISKGVNAKLKDVSDKTLGGKSGKNQPIFNFDFQPIKPQH